MKANTNSIADKISFKDPTSPTGVITHKPTGYEPNKEAPPKEKASQESLAKLAGRFSK